MAKIILGKSFLRNEDIILTTTNVPGEDEHLCGVYVKSGTYEPKVVDSEDFFEGLTLEEKVQKVIAMSYVDADVLSAQEDEIGLAIYGGDWKHEHLFMDHLIRTLFGMTLYDVDVNDEDGSDTYSARRLYVKEVA